MALQYDCPEPDCSFVVRANTEYEVFEFVESHAQTRHGVWLSGRTMHDRLTES
jgi:predicted small metal-binding protein